MAALGSAKPQFPKPCQLIVATLMLALGASAFALELPAGLVDGGGGVVREVIDGDTVLLEDGREVRLVGIQAPKLPLGRAGFEPWPLADVAKRNLEELVLGQAVRLGYGGRRTDRHRRQLAHLFRAADGLWVQGALLAAGMARIYTFADNRALVPELLGEERAARANSRGIWAEPYYTVRDHRDTDRVLDSFAVIEGAVVDTAVVRGRGFLNFGEDYRTDFTITLAPDVVDLFEAEGIVVDDYLDRCVRVRGWVQWRNGPSISATHPEQIELLDC